MELELNANEVAPMVMAIFAKHMTTKLREDYDLVRWPPQIARGEGGGAGSTQLTPESGHRRPPGRPRRACSPKCTSLYQACPAPSST